MTLPAAAAAMKYSTGGQYAVPSTAHGASLIYGQICKLDYTSLGSTDEIENIVPFDAVGNLPLHCHTGITSIQTAVVYYSVYLADPVYLIVCKASAAESDIVKSAERKRRRRLPQRNSPS